MISGGYTGSGEESIALVAWKVYMYQTSWDQSKNLALSRVGFSRLIYFPPSLDTDQSGLNRLKIVMAQEVYELLVAGFFYLENFESTLIAAVFTCI